MNHVEAAISRMRALSSAGFARSPKTRPELQKQFEGFDECVGTAEPPEDLMPFLKRVQEAGPEKLARPELYRALRGVWHDAAFDDFGLALVGRAETDVRRPSDQAIIEGYLTYFPYDRPCIGQLAAAAAKAADRRDWAWQKRATRWKLFDHNRGPANVAQDIQNDTSDDPGSLLASMGIGRNIAATRFGQQSFVAACGNIKNLVGAKAIPAQARLLKLFDHAEQARDLPLLVQALLEPWLSSKPEKEHRRALSDFLVHQVGDPRTTPDRWKYILSTIAKTEGAERAAEIIQVLKRWLTEVAMRMFFAAIAKTTDRPDQWDQRSKFWLAYLDAGMVTDAWPALGQRACRRIEEIIRQSGEKPDYGIMRGGPQSSSSIIMQIGDLRIAEWSDNGACRFWSDSDKSAPRLFGKAYDGGALRAMSGGRDFEYESHVPPSPGWEGKFAGIIHRRTAIAHPKLGRGRGRYWGETW